MVSSVPQHHLRGRRILVVKDGEIVERGGHNNLLADGVFYHDLYLSQF